MENDQLPLTVNDKLSHFELHADGHTAFIKYKITGNNFFLIHTEAPESLKGKRPNNIKTTILYDIN
jgi:hypothetical protein